MYNLYSLGVYFLGWMCTVVWTAGPAQDLIEAEVILDWRVLGNRVCTCLSKYATGTDRSLLIVFGPAEGKLQ